MVSHLRSWQVCDLSVVCDAVFLGMGASMTEDEIADLDALVYYYTSQGWPSYTEHARRIKPEWSDKLSQAQADALRRHLDRINHFWNQFNARDEQGDHTPEL